MISQEFNKYLDWKRKLVLALVLSHFFAVLVFNVLAVYFPEVMVLRMISDWPLTVGTVFAIFIVISVIAASFYYSHLVNLREAKLPRQEEPKDQN